MLHHNWNRYRCWLLPALCLGLLLTLPIMRIHAQQLTEPKVKVAERDYANDPYWQQARKEVYKGAEELQAQHETELRRGWKLATFLRGNTRRKEIAFTFDDGPHPLFTPQLLKILHDEKVPATFFVVGEMAEKYPDLIRAEVADGHDVGNHTYHHVNLTKILSADVATEIQACADVIKRITGQTPHLLRPPGGDYDKGVAETAEALGYTTILWTDDPGDYTSPGDPVIFKRTIEHISPGGIILLHDGIQETIDMLPKLITAMRKRGYKFVTVDQLMKDSR